MKKINILHINHISRTGSGNVIKNIVDFLPKEIFNSQILVGYDFDNCKNTDSVYVTDGSFFYRQIRYKLFVGLNFVFDIMTPCCITLQYFRLYKAYQEADIIHIHCPQGGYFNWHDLPYITKEKKVVLTMHDDWLTSGNDSMNLYYPYKTRGQFNIRYNVFKKCDIHYVGVSSRCTKKLIQSLITADNEVRTIYNGINTNIFTKKDKKDMRAILDLPQDKTIIVSLAGSGSKSNVKGLGYATKVMKEYCHEHDYLFITLGNHKNKKISDNLWEIGYVDQYIVSQYFSAADVFLYPTLMDSFGLIIAESISCGCPVVTFDVGGVPEIVQHKKSGYVARYKDYEDLLRGFERVLSHKKQMNVILDQKFTQKNMVEQYVDLYKSLI